MTLFGGLGLNCYVWRMLRVDKQVNSVGSILTTMLRLPTLLHKSTNYPKPQVNQQLMGKVLLDFSIGMYKARRLVRGTKPAFAPLLIIIGLNQELRCIRIAELLGYSRENCHKRLKLLIELGYISKSKQCYSLANKGQLVINTLFGELNASLNLLLSDMYRQVREEVTKV